jgi:hypothetical protein
LGLSLSGICYTGDKSYCRLRDDFDEVDRLLEEKYPGVYDVHNFLRQNGLRDALRGNKPTRTRGAFQILNPTVNMFREVAKGTTPLMRSFKVVAISAGMVYGNPESLTLLQGWGDDWKEKKDLEASIGYKISDLEMATVDASELVNVAGSRPWEARTVPKRRTTKDEHGEPVLKRLRDEGKKPATCPCGNTFVSAAKVRPGNPGIKCVGKKGCGKFIAQYD